MTTNPAPNSDPAAPIAAVDPPTPDAAALAAAGSAPKDEPAKVDPSVKEDVKTPEAKAPVEYKLTAPEGVKLDDKKLSQFTEMARKFTIPPDEAQAMLNLYTEDMQTATGANKKAWTDLQAQWKSELDKDPELGGPKGVEAQVVIGRALDTYGSKEARAALDLTGAGNNPHVARLIFNMAKALDEGGPVPPGGNPGKNNKTLGERFYGGTS